MTYIRIQIVRFADPAQPGWVEAELTDAFGQTSRFVEKVPVVAAAPLDETSDYPQPGGLACRVVRRWHDAAGRELVTVDTGLPWGVESTGGRASFDLLPGQVVERSGGFVDPVGKYARREIERRFLLRRPPAELAGRAADLRITDHYLPGTRLRLRRIESADGGVVLKLGQKFRAPGQDALETTMTNLVLNESEYALLRTLGGTEVVEDRFIYLDRGRRYAVDLFRGRLEGLVLAEAEFESREWAAALPPPEFAAAEVTHDPRFTGGELARLSGERLAELLRTHRAGP